RRDGKRAGDAGKGEERIRALLRQLEPGHDGMIDAARCEFGPHVELALQHVLVAFAAVHEALYGDELRRRARIDGGIYLRLGQPAAPLVVGVAHVRVETEGVAQAMVEDGAENARRAVEPVVLE